MLECYSYNESNVVRGKIKQIVHGDASKNTPAQRVIIA